MQELAAAIPDVKVLLTLTPEELGAKLLFLLRKRKEARFHPNNLDNELWHSNQPPYPRQYQEALGETRTAVDD